MRDQTARGMYSLGAHKVAKRYAHRIDIHRKLESIETGELISPRIQAASSHKLSRRNFTSVYNYHGYQGTISVPGKANPSPRRPGPPTTLADIDTPEFTLGLGQCSAAAYINLGTNRPLQPPALRGGRKASRQTQQTDVP